MKQLSEYKKYIREIKHKKGTVVWLKEFVKIAEDYSVPKTKNAKTIIADENLSIQEFIYLRVIIRKLENGEACEFINKGLADFLTKYGFNVEPVEIGWIVSEVKQ